MFSKKTMKAVDVATVIAAYTPGAPVSVKELSDLLDVSVSYLETILSQLKRHRLVTTTRGPGGGYQLSGDAQGRPGDFSLWDVVQIFESTALDQPKQAGSQPRPMLDAVADDIQLNLKTFCQTQRLTEMATKLSLPPRSKTVAVVGSSQFKLKPLPPSSIPQGMNSVFQWATSLGTRPGMLAA